MIHQLKENEYKSVRSLYRNLRFNLVVDSALDGTTPAWVFVDHKDKPQTAAMWNKQDALLLAGYAGNDELLESFDSVKAGAQAASTALAPNKPIAFKNFRLER